MPQFRKRSWVVDAVQVPADGNHRAVPGVCDCEFTPYETTHIHTLDGPRHVSAGDWVVTNGEGNRFPMRPSAFHMEYEPI